MQNKKALSALVATILLVLITVAVVGLIWGAIIPMISSGMEEATAKQQCLSTGISIQLTGTVHAGGLTVNIERGDSTANVSRVMVQAISATGASQTFQCPRVPGVFENVMCQNTSAITLPDIAEVDALAYVQVKTKEYPCTRVGKVAIA